MSYYYLASPYSHFSPEVLEERFRLAMSATAWMLKQRRWVYSPIVHCHQLAQEHVLPTDADYWRDYDFAMLDSAAGLIVLLLPGWQESKGMKAEIIRAIERDKEIFDIEPDGDGWKLGHGKYFVK